MLLALLLLLFLHLKLAKQTIRFKSILLWSESKFCIMFCKLDAATAAPAAADIMDSPSMLSWASRALPAREKPCVCMCCVYCGHVPPAKAGPRGSAAHRFVRGAPSTNLPQTLVRKSNICPIYKSLTRFVQRFGPMKSVHKSFSSNV